VGDLTRVTQVIGNVLGNAVKYTNAGGKIELSAWQDGGAVEIRIRDNGIGIPGSVLPRVFDLFSQAGVMDERSRGGLGIGLALVKRLVDLHDGSVSVYSAGVGLGTEFTIRLPAAQTEQDSRPAAEPQAAEPTAPIACKRRLLLVDDNQDALASLATLLRLAGHDIHTAADGFLALEAAPRFLPEIGVLDIGMPGLDGYELARRMRKQPWGKSMVLIALTGWGQENDRRRSREAGFDSHWLKPLDMDQFMSYLERLDEPAEAREPGAKGGARVRIWPRSPAQRAT
jgi:CheY-like chemotaxis protein/anti-sigma regulatory factor (Ser/Thr protein kinase)